MRQHKQCFNSKTVEVGLRWCGHFNTGSSTEVADENLLNVDTGIGTVNFSAAASAILIDWRSINSVIGQSK